MKNKELLELYFTEYKKSFFEKAKNYHSLIRGSDRDSKPESFNTIFTWLSLFLNINDKQIEKSVTDGTNDYSIDAIYIPNSDNIYKNIVIFDFKWNSSLNYEDIKKFVSYTEKYILNWNDLPREWNKELLEKLKELHKYINDNPNVKIDIIIYREQLNNNWLIRNEENRLQILKSKFDKIGEIKIFWKENVLNLLANKLWYEWNIYASNFSNFNINYNKKDIIKVDENIIIWTVSLFDLLVFIQRIEDYNYKCLSYNRKYDIFKLNVRNKSGKSKWIRDWIIKTVENEPEKFLSYHNWITITCENFKFNDTLINFEQPQIVNWCQTISWLYEYFKESIIEYFNIINWLECNYRNKEDVIKWIKEIEKLRKAKINIKIIVAEQLSKEPKKISHFANSQTVVTYTDLLSNDLEQLIISNYLRLNWFNYFRKEWQYLEKGKSTISMDQIYKFMYSYVLLDPSKWKQLKQNVFEDEIYNKLFPWIFKITDIIKISNLYKSANDYIKRKNISKYYNDFIVFWLFLIYKENNLSNIKPHTIKILLDSILEEKIWKKVLEFESYDLMKYLQRTSMVVNDLILQLEKKYDFILDREKFKDFINSFRKKMIEERNERMKNIIYYKWYNLNKLNDYLKEKEENKKQFKNLIWIIYDIVSENNWKINRQDLYDILNKFNNYSLEYFNERLGKNNDKIIEKEWFLYIYDLNYE